MQAHVRRARVHPYGAATGEGEGIVRNDLPEAAGQPPAIENDMEPKKLQKRC
ncbi:hypothetical protein [Sphingomonas hankookensis]|jgi:hypothetical protein|uniref:hypothetical protein n=1 Tax=Sphingomonas hankookensis TaxID=563996 RepID=UPI000B33EA36|nr:hypothetical protein [Sphingomonas hankookensis]